VRKQFIAKACFSFLCRQTIMLSFLGLEMTHSNVFLYITRVTAWCQACKPSSLLGIRALEWSTFPLSMSISTALASGF